MKVKDLIESLQTFEENAEVVLQDSDEMMVLYEIESLGYIPTDIGKTVAINPIYGEDSSNVRTDKA